ncbi:cupin [Microbulbifer flavimaris]|uniref:Cupin n=1 Tax=Microbulbifer flavimaris TaxID=1781068 RepID=A0ABX4HZT4_9GAMM|nr:MULTISPECIES: cupin domain-containing protein [Microbulbifer]KUJ83475.1 cupin [Microbulbifer sp. ZGT114]PCO05634.1 cupin [Microbulbifer flavimaris]
MDLNANFDRRAVIRPGEYQWRPSPVAGVERMMLDRIGDEVARATSIVRYAPNSTFPEHTHGGGEEILVLEGAFGDEYGSYPAGTYIRNPIGSSHSPSVGPEGCTIFVKLHQHSEKEKNRIVIDTRAAQWQPGLVPGLSVLGLHELEGERVALVRWAPYTQFQQHMHLGGEEIFVIEGTFFDEHGEYPRGSWIRSPHLSEHTPFTREDGALIYVKTGHL